MPEVHDTQVPAELKDLRKRFGFTLARCADVLGLTIEGYRLKENGIVPVSGPELARLADLYGMPLSAAFPSYIPTPGERSLAKHLNPAA